MQTQGDLLCAIEGCSQRAYDITASGRMACRDCWEFMLPETVVVSLRSLVFGFVRKVFVGA